MEGRKQRYTRKDVVKSYLLAISLLLLTLSLAYFIKTTDILEPKLDLVSTSNISFNNSNATDMLKISNLKKLTEEKGKSSKNKSMTKISISGSKDAEYQIVLYHIGNMVAEEYVHYELSNSKVLLTGNLSSADENNDGGRIIYEGSIKDNKEFELKMWLDKEYEENINNVSYEIRIKSK